MATKVQDLECWRLADRLRGEVHAVCAQKEVARCFRFCAGFTEAAGSVCHNISEGFARFSSTQIVQFFGYALGSLGEVEDYLREAATRNFIDQERLQNDLELAAHTRATLLRFRRYHQEKSARKRATRRY